MWWHIGSIHSAIHVSLSDQQRVPIGVCQIGRCKNGQDVTTQCDSHTAQPVQYRNFDVEHDIIRKAYEDELNTIRNEWNRIYDQTQQTIADNRVKDIFTYHSYSKLKPFTEFRITDERYDVPLSKLLPVIYKMSEIVDVIKKKYSV